MNVFLSVFLGILVRFRPIAAFVLGHFHVAPIITEMEVVNQKMQDLLLKTPERRQRDSSMLSTPGLPVVESGKGVNEVTTTVQESDLYPPSPAACAFPVVVPHRIFVGGFQPTVSTLFLWAKGLCRPKIMCLRHDFLGETRGKEALLNVSKDGIVICNHVSYLDYGTRIAVLFRAFWRSAGCENHTGRFERKYKTVSWICFFHVRIHLFMLAFFRRYSYGFVTYSTEEEAKSVIQVGGENAQLFHYFLTQRVSFFSDEQSSERSSFQVSRSLFERQRSREEAAAQVIAFR